MFLVQPDITVGCGHRCSRAQIRPHPPGMLLWSEGQQATLLFCVSLLQRNSCTLSNLPKINFKSLQCFVTRPSSSDLFLFLLWGQIIQLAVQSRFSMAFSPLKDIIIFIFVGHIFLQMYSSPWISDTPYIARFYNRFIFRSICCCASMVITNTPMLRNQQRSQCKTPFFRYQCHCENTQTTAFFHSLATSTSPFLNKIFWQYWMWL